MLARTQHITQSEPNNLEISTDAPSLDEHPLSNAQSTWGIVTPEPEIAQAARPTLHIVTLPHRTATPLGGALGPANFPPDVNPLTGLTVADPSVLERRPMVVKISNSPPLVRPQAGLGAADIVFEHYTEGGVTRFSAIFYSQAPNRVGSIRSARLIDHELTAMFHGVLSFAGASLGVEKYIYGSEDVHQRVEGSENTAPFHFIPPSEYAERAYRGISYGRPYYWRDELIPVPHNLFVDTTALWELAAEEGHAQRPALRGLAFHPQPLQAQMQPIDSVDVIDLRYRTTRVRWEYDATSSQYLRFTDGQGHFDANTERQITADNVVILYTEHTDTEIVESIYQESVVPSTQIAVWGSGDVILFRDGQQYTGRWVRTIREDIIALRDENEQGFLYLKPGNTWFQVVRLPQQQIPEEEWLRLNPTPSD